MLGIVGTLAGVIVGALINHVLEKGRNRESLILNKKIKVYSNILVELSSVFQARETNLALDRLSLSKMKSKIAVTLSAGRLLAGEKLEKRLRDYHGEATLFWEGKKDDNTMSKLVIEIEQLIREELGQKRLYNVPINN